MQNRLLFLFSTLLLISISCSNNGEYVKIEKSNSKAAFAGSNTCKQCHQEQFNNWLGSDHERAMDRANEKSVIGDFNNSTFTYKGFTSRFYKRDGKFYVYTLGLQAKAREYQIQYTFGVRPIQQYLIETENGRLQCLPIGWDSQSNKWFTMVQEVYHGQEFADDDWLFWTNNGQNWNGMCAECHSTNLTKGYNLREKKYDTHYSEISVGCESCHGPGSNHNKWAMLSPEKKLATKNSGFDTKTVKLNAQEHVNQCGYCHSRRQSHGDYQHGNGYYLNHWNPQLLHQEYYHSDGQILEENYVIGSYLQSKMYRHNISCSNCHDPHSNTTKFKGNQLCFQCHSENNYGQKHHFHSPKNIAQKPNINGYYDNQKGDGTQCVDCHMPGQNFMGYDFRRDHSIRIPRPDLSIRNNTPNACQQCHSDKSNQWLAKSIEKWFNKKIIHPNDVVYNAFADARKGETNAVNTIVNHILNNDSINSIYRASALGYLSQFDSPKASKAIENQIYNSDPLIRQAAVKFYNISDKKSAQDHLAPLLNDSVKSVRIEVLNKVSMHPTLTFDPRFEKYYNNALEEYINAMEYSGDFATGLYNLANLEIKRANHSKAIEYLRQSLQIDNSFIPSAINLSILLSRQNLKAQAIEILEKAESKNPNSFEANYYLGLLHAELNDTQKALWRLEKALNIAPDNTRAAYNLALIYQSMGKIEQAETKLIHCIRLEPNAAEYHYALAQLYINNNMNQKAAQIYKTMKSKFANSNYTADLNRYYNSY